jgi:hypothetical protein
MNSIDKYAFIFNKQNVEDKIEEYKNLTLEEKKKAEKRFKYWVNKLRNKGVFAGTYHKRVIIPKTSLSEDHIKALGFEPVFIGIPESGQDRFSSFRHADNLLHLHSHGDKWTIHEDEHPSLTMALRKASPKEIPKALLSGFSHIFTEGVPGAYKYIANRLKGSDNMLSAIDKDQKVQKKLKNQIINPEQLKQAFIKTFIKKADEYNYNDPYNLDAYRSSNVRPIYDENNNIIDYETDVTKNPGIIPSLKRNKASIYGATLAAAGIPLAKIIRNKFKKRPTNLEQLAGLSILAGGLGYNLPKLLGMNEYSQGNLRDEADKKAIKEYIKKNKIASDNFNESDVPTFEQLRAVYPKSFTDMMNLKRRNVETIPKKDIVKNVRIVSDYKDVLEAAKEQKQNILGRHIAALLTRSSVWAGNNASFHPVGKNGFIVSPRRINEDVIKHELGHAEDYARLKPKGFDEAYYSYIPNETSNDNYIRTVLLPEARAWHYAGKPVNLKDQHGLKERAFGSYLTGMDTIEE